jgi:hypothetical protein
MSLKDKFLMVWLLLYSNRWLHLGIVFRFMLEEVGLRRGWKEGCG